MRRTGLRFIINGFPAQDDALTLLFNIEIFDWARELNLR